MQSNSRRRHASRLSLTFAVASAASAAFAPSAFSQTVVTWTAGTGDYNVSANWDPVVIPSNAANHYLEINNGGTAQVSTGGEGTFLHLGYAPGDVGHLEVSDGTLTLGELRVGGRETIPDGLGGFVGNGGGTGSVLQSGGTVSVTYSTGTEPPVQSAYIGDSGLDSGNSASGTYTLTAGTLNVGLYHNDQLVLATGPGAHGTFIQSGGDVTSTGNLWVGRRGGTATYTMSAGTITLGTGPLATGSTSGSTGSLYVGDGDTAAGAAASTVGTFIQTGGSVRTGALPAPVPGTLTAASSEIGRRGGTGTYIISGGSMSFGGQLNIGSSSTTAGLEHAVGTLNISDSASVSTTAGNNVFVGFNSGQTAFSSTTSSVGTLAMSGGTLTLNNTLLAIGSGTGTTGNLNISGGTLQFATTLEIDLGRFSGVGHATLSGDGVIKCTNFYIGGNASNIGSDATFDMSGGSLTTTNLVLSATARTDTNSTRTFNMTGGSLTAATFNQNTSNPGDAVTRTFNMSGGTLTVTGNTTGGFSTTYNITGGTADFQGNYTTNASTLNVGGSANVTIAHLNPSGTQGGWINLSGNATLTSPDFHAGFNSAANPATFTQTGGTLNATTFTSGGTQTRLFFSGGNINIGTLILSGGTILTSDNNISLPSSVTLGSTAAAGSTTLNVNTGSLTLSGPISNFAGNPTMNLVKTGAGTLILSGNNSYAGATRVDGGTVLAGPNALVPIMSNSPGGAILNSGKLLLDYSASPSLPTDLAAFLKSSHDSSNFTDTTQRFRTTNASDPAHGIGYTLDSATSLATVMYTWYGDANLSGNIDPDDYALFDAGLAKARTGWQNGDFDYSGTVDSADALLLDTSLALSGGALSPDLLSQRAAQFGDAYVSSLLASVPEPTSLAACALAALPTLRRRRK